MLKRGTFASATVGMGLIGAVLFLVLAVSGYQTWVNVALGIGCLALAGLGAYLYALARKS